MRLYHPLRHSSFLLGMLFLLAACAAPQVAQKKIGVTVTADGGTVTLNIPAGSSAEDALNAAGVVLGSLDRSEPPLYTILNDGSKVRLIRVSEEFSVEQVIVPYADQVIRNESLPQGEEYWLQLGQNGLKEITIRRVYEDDQEISEAPVKEVVLKEALPQIKMIGVQEPFAPFAIPGRLAYLLNGDAWVMEGNTGERRQIVKTGDLDGRIFSLSPDGEWLLFTRSSNAKDTINTLWAVQTSADNNEPVDLKVSNIIHFAAWKPGSTLTIGYSTVEPRQAAPGWQANNDLWQLSFSSSGEVNAPYNLLEANQGGVYGWWGTNFAWSPDGLRLVFARPDGIGLLDLLTGGQTILAEQAPLSTVGDWAWVPGIDWGPDGSALYFVDHLPPEQSADFNLVALPFDTGKPVTLGSGVGLFAYPVASPLQKLPSGEAAYQIAYLQALSPAQKENSKVRLIVMDRDGSNRRTLFPAEGPGLDPQHVVWSPQPLEEPGHYALALVYQNNLWLVDSQTGEAWQVTGDQLTSRVDWK